MARTYVETSVPSFYFEARPEAEMVARRDWTRAWWDASVAGRELVTSLAVIEELDRGDFPARDDCLALIATLPIVAVEPPILEIVEGLHQAPGDARRPGRRRAPSRAGLLSSL